MAATYADVQTMATDGRCFECVSEKTLMAAQVLLLWQSVNGANPMTASDVAGLVADAKCLDCLSHKQLLALNVSLLFSGVVPGGSAGQLTEGHGPPPNPPTDASKIAIYFDLDDGRQMYEWSVEAQSWG